jgi:FixJ family two-component response regulator
MFPAFRDNINASQEDRVKITKKGSGLVILVEDDESLRNMIKTMIMNLGYEAVEFALPQKAVEFCRDTDRHIDCLVTDVIMPGMNGKDMVQKIMETRPDIKVLFMSGYPEDIISDKGVLKKGIRFIHKPFMMKDFAEKLRDTVCSAMNT